MTQDTFHTVGSQDYKVDHLNKVVYRKQYLSKHALPEEHRMFPDGFKWINTGGDYIGFCAKYSADKSPEPYVEEIKPSISPSVVVESEAPGDVPVEIPAISEMFPLALSNGDNKPGLIAKANKRR